MADRADLFEEAVRTLRHDARNVLGAVAVMAEHFENQKNQRGLEYTEYLEAKLAAMVRLSDRTQKLATIDAAAHADFELGLLVSLGLEAVSYAPPTKPRVELPRGTVKADEELSVLALSEVIDNAARTHAEVRITGEVEDDRVIVRVRDFGMGIEPSAEQHLFEPLAGARREGGAALGLVLAKKAMALQDGDLEVLNSKHGVTVVLTWPRA